MKWMTVVSLAACLLIVPIATAVAVDDGFFTSACGDGEVKFIFFKQSALLIRMADKTMLIDPANSVDKDTLEKIKRHGLDLLMYTHAHYDHYDYTTAMKLFADTGAHIVAAPQVAKELKREIPDDKITMCSHLGRYSLNGMDVKSIKGKHIGPIFLYHITVGKIRVFHGGDSSYISLVDHSADVAFVPTGDPSPTCSPKKAFKMAKDIKPEVAVAIHGSSHQNEAFKRIMQEGLPDARIVLANRLEAVLLHLTDNL